MSKRSALIPVVCVGLVASACVLVNSKLTAADAPASDWHIAGPFGGSAKSIALDPKNPNVVLAGAMNSLVYRSSDGGDDWQLLDFPKRNLSEVTSILVDPNDSKHYFAGVISADGGGLFESSDEGKTWTVVKGMDGFGVRSIVAAASKPTRLVSGTTHGVMMSDDSGATWTRISDTQNMEMQGITAVAVDPQNPDLIYAGTSHLPWKTADGGRTWTSIHNGMIDDSDVFSLYVDHSNPEDIFASACSGIYASIDRGDMWKKLIGIPNTSRRTHIIRKDPDNSNVILAGTTAGLFKSNNDGKSWRTLTDAQVNSLVFNPNKAGQMYLAMEYEGLGRAAEDGDQITISNTGFVNRSISWVTRAGDKFFAIEPSLGDTSGVFVSSDKGESWKRMPDVRGLLGVHLRAITGEEKSDKMLIAAGPRELYKSTDGGFLWKALPMKLVVEESVTVPVKRTAKGKLPAKGPRTTTKTVEKLRSVTPSEFFGLYTVEAGTKQLVFAATDLGLYKSRDAGERWTTAELGDAGSVTGLFIAPNSDGRLVARSTTGLYYSNDFGDHWAKYNLPFNARDINDVGIPISHSDPLLVASLTGLYRTPDEGVNWSRTTGGLPASTVSSVLYTGTEKTAYAVQYGRLFESSDAGESWKLVPSTLPTTRIRQLWMPDSSSNRLYGITTDLGILFRN